MRTFIGLGNNIPEKGSQQEKKYSPMEPIELFMQEKCSDWTTITEHTQRQFKQRFTMFRILELSCVTSAFSLTSWHPGKVDIV